MSPFTCGEIQTFRVTVGRQTGPAWSQHLKSSGIQAERQIPPAFLCGIIFISVLGRLVQPRIAQCPFWGHGVTGSGSGGGRGAVLQPQLRWMPFLDAPGQIPWGAAQLQLVSANTRGHCDTEQCPGWTRPQPLPPPVPSRALPQAPPGLSDIGLCPFLTRRWGS